MRVAPLGSPGLCEPTLMFDRPRHRDPLAWIGCVIWAAAAALLSLTIGAFYGVDLLLWQLLIVLTVAGCIVAASFLLPGHRAQCEPLSYDRIRPGRRTEVRRGIALTARLQSLTEAAMPGPVADHLAELERFAHRELELIVVRATSGELLSTPERSGDEAPESADPTERLEGLVAVAECLANAQLRALDSGIEGATRRTELLAATLTSCSDRGCA